MAPCRMKQILIEGSGVQGRLNCDDIQHGGIGQHQTLWKHGDEIRLRHNMQGLQIVWDCQYDVSFAAFLAQPCVDWILGEFTRHHRNMPRNQETIARHRTGKWMISSHCAGVAVGKQALLIEALKSIRRTCDHDVNLARKRHGVESGHGCRLQPSGDARGILAQSFEQRRKEHTGGVV